MSLSLSFSLSLLLELTPGAARPSLELTGPRRGGGDLLQLLPLPLSELRLRGGGLLDLHQVKMTRIEDELINDDKSQL